MPTKNIFISHVHEDDSRLSELKELLAKQGYDIRDGSIDSSKPNNAENPEYIKSKILAPRINWAGAMIVLISAKTCESSYVNWEIEYAQKKEMPIIGVWDIGAKDSDLPEKFKMYGDDLCGWNGKCIVNALEGKGDGWHDPNGKSYPDREIKRIKCQ